MITVHPYRVSELAPRHWRMWAELQRRDPALESPYFCPEFTRAVAEVRSNVEVGVLQDGCESVGFFPFHRHSNGVGRPIGERLSDFHGLIVRRDVDWEPADVLQQCGLSVWHYDHLITSQEQFQPYHRDTLNSPYLDLSHGFDCYWEQQRQMARKKITQIESCMRKLEREQGALRLGFDTQDEEALEQLMAWKSDQYHRHGLVDEFAIPWIRQLLQNFVHIRSEGFSSVIITLHAGERLVAVANNLRSRHVMHGWYMSYDRHFARYSPGFLLLSMAARAAAEQGIRRFDLGKGPETYKLKFASGNRRVCEGSLDFSPSRRFLRDTLLRAVKQLKSSPLRKPLANLTRPVRQRYHKATLR